VHRPGWQLAAACGGAGRHGPTPDSTLALNCERGRTDGKLFRHRLHAGGPNPNYLTDLRDACIILLIGSAPSALATLSFGLFANGLLSASLIWGLAGIGFAGTYMPGLKARTDRLGPGTFREA
jgi:hypothetical protein